MRKIMKFSKASAVICFFIIFFVSLPVFSEQENINVEKKLETEIEQINSSKPSPKILKSIASLRQTILERIEEKQKRIKNTDSASEIANLQEELKKLDKQLHETQNDFERIATGIDTGLFTEKKEEKFDWKDEVASLVKPGINELKRLTEKSREKSKLKDEIEKYDKLVPHAETAVKNIKDLIETSQDSSLETYLQNLLSEWKGIKKQLENKRHIANLKLTQMESKKKSFVESAQSNVKKFFKTKGLFILTAIIVSILIVMFLRFLHDFIAKRIPGYNADKRPFHVKAFELGYRVLSFLLTMISIILVFYIAQDWTLLSFAIIFLLGLAWGLKNTIPKMFKQSKLMLNIGQAREGERINYQGVSWLIQDINFYSKIENPDLGITLRVPIEVLLDKISRPNNPDEPFFPCRKNDWVILSDNTRGKVVSLSHEMVKLVMRGGASKTYQTPDFLSMSPLNLSSSFRIKETFGLSYGLQKDITDKIPGIISEYITKKIEEARLDEFLLNLRTEFETAGASSLDIVVIADFKGEAADIYNRIKRLIQSWCVEASTINNWEIPFPQLTVHQP
jgi:predicted PurR-regulated permease PerM